MARGIHWISVVTRPIACLALLAAVFFLPQSPPAYAGCGWVTHVVSVQGAQQVTTEYVCSGDEAVVPGVDVEGPADPTEMGVVCTNAAMELGLDPFETCWPSDEEDSLEVTPELVAAAMKFVPLPPSVLQVQPSNGRTLVNFDTNFFAEAQPFDTALTLLGQRVDLHIVPTEFGWRFGDGESVATAEPGAPYPDLDVTHRYLKKGKVAPSVDTTYTAEFRVNGGGWEDVPGSVTIAGAPVDLEVLTATPTLVGYDRG
jgi:hypothetical protein